MLVGLIVILLSFCQSMFGMGLLIFGTPILLFLDHSFVQALWILLPASFSISSLQLLGTSEVDPVFKSHFLRWSLPSLLITLAAYLFWQPGIDVAWIVGPIMIFYSIVRVLPEQIDNWFSDLVKKYLKVSMIIMGAVHGVSNMGGSVLSVISGSQFREKVQVRNAIVYCYWFFGAVQLSLLSIFSLPDFNLASLFFAPIAALVYLIMGKKSFTLIKQNIHRRFFTLFIFLCGLALLTK